MIDDRRCKEGGWGADFFHYLNWYDTSVDTGATAPLNSVNTDNIV